MRPTWCAVRLVLVLVLVLPLCVRAWSPTTWSTHSVDKMCHPPTGRVSILSMLDADDSPLERSLLAARACSLAFVPPRAMSYEPYAAGLTCICQVEDPVSLAGATMLRRESDGLVIIACRGSASIRNFRTNLDVGPVPLTADPQARVHNGFQRAGKALWGQLRSQLPPLPASSGVDVQPPPMLITGHSLGGGTATIVSLLCHEAGRQAELITIAGPRLGDAAFAAHYRKRCAIPASHLVHDADDVLRSNTDLWNRLGFEHVGAKVRCSKDDACLYDALGAVEVCQLESEASPAPAGPPSLKGIFVDHCKYLGLYIGVRLEHPWGIARL